MVPATGDPVMTTQLTDGAAVNWLLMLLPSDGLMRQMCGHPMLVMADSPKTISSALKLLLISTDGVGGVRLPSQVFGIGLTRITFTKNFEKKSNALESGLLLSSLY